MIQQKLTKEMNQSPKGLGYCTHSEKLGRKMKGKDGNKWIIIENKNKVKRWIKLNNDSLNKSLFNKLFSKLEKKYINGG